MWIKVKMVRIEWNDSCSDDGWMRQNSDRAKAHTISHCTSVGFLFKKDKTQICLAQNTSNYGSIGDLMAIPRKCVTRIVELKEGI